MPFLKKPSSASSAVIQKQFHYPPSDSFHNFFIQNMNKLVKNKIVGTIIILIASALIIYLIQLLTSSFLLASLLYAVALFFLLRLIAFLLLYPGNFFYFRAVMEIRFSRELSAKLVGVFRVLATLQQNIIENRVCRDECFGVSVEKSIHSAIRMLEMYEATLSKRKVKLLGYLRDLKHHLQDKSDGNTSLLELIAKRRRVKSIRQQCKSFYESKFVEIAAIIKQIDAIIQSFVPPQNILLYLKFLIFDQNLFEIRFGFNNWTAMFHYQVHQVPVDEKDFIETGIIHKQLGKEEGEGKKAVLLCNPNGVYIQFFADHYYVLNYLKLGYHVILWNYRGYGQSTGTSSLLKSQKDAYAVYRFYRAQGYTIEVVHGYSIGGPASLGLVQAISKNKQSHPEDDVGLLIIDRSFSSIGEILVEFGWVAKKLARIVLCDQNIDMSILYQEAKCKKLIIWDSIDEIISGRASLKYAVIQRILGEKIKPRTNELNEEVTVEYSHKDQFNSICMDFHTAIQKITALMKRRSECKQITTVSQEVSSASASTTDKIDQFRIDELTNDLSLVDGGGVRIFQDYNLWEIQEVNPKQFSYICQSYVLGLICYGSCLPLSPNMHCHESMKTQTQRKISLLLQQLRVKYGAKSSEGQQCIQESSSQIAKNIYTIYSKISNAINERYGEQWVTNYGNLLPIRTGHNNSLNLIETQALNTFLRGSLRENDSQI